MSKLKASDGLKMDFYGLMRLRPYATEKEVRKAYRKQALKLHPDKNPNNPNAAKNFQNLQKAFELLLDPVEKAEYDRLLRAKEAAEERRKEQDEKTRSFREKLERREAELKKQKEEKDEYHKIERLRRQAEREEEERLLEEERVERDKMKEKLKERERKKNEYNVKVKWSKGCDYGCESLKRIFSKYGAVQEIVMRDQSRIALLQYDNQLSAMRSLGENDDVSKKIKVELMFQVDYTQADDDDNDEFEEFEKHFLKVLQQKGQQAKQAENSPCHSKHQNSHQENSKPKNAQPKNSRHPHSKEDILHQQPNHHPPKISRDFESLQERTLRQAEERKRLIEEMIKNDE